VSRLFLHPQIGSRVVNGRGKEGAPDRTNTVRLFAIHGGLRFQTGLLMTLHVRSRCAPVEPVAKTIAANPPATGRKDNDCGAAAARNLATQCGKRYLCGCGCLGESQDYFINRHKNIPLVYDY